MKLTFKLLLGASLAGNLVFAWLAAYTIFPRQLGIADVAPAVLTAMRVADARLPNSVEPPSNPDLADPHTVAATLRNRRYHETLVRILASQAFTEKYQVERWRSAAKLGLPGAAARHAELEQLRKVEMDALFPPKAGGQAQQNSPAAAVAQLQQNLEFGDLSPAKIAVLDARHDELFRAFTDEKLEAILTSILEPAEIEDYMRFHSYLAREIQGRLRNIAVDEATYLAFYESERRLPPEMRRANPTPPAVGRTYLEKFGAEKFLTMIHEFNVTAGSADIVYQEAGLSPAKRVELFFQADAAEREIRSANSDTRAATAASAYAALIANAGLTDRDQLAKFERSPIAGYLRKRAAEQR